MERLPAERHRSRYLLPFAVDRELHGAAVLLVHRKGAVGIATRMLRLLGSSQCAGHQQMQHNNAS